MFTRSTKGASKLRRELINVEINRIRDLLPLQDGIRKRLSQLQVMAICKAFIGKNNLFRQCTFSEVPCSSQEDEDNSSFDFSPALSGFLLMSSADGKLLYLSDNVMEILGHSMVDFMTQSESVFDLLDDRGQSRIIQLLSNANRSNDNLMSSVSDDCSQDEDTFICLMGMARNARRHPGLDRQKVMRITARLLKPTNSFVDAEPVLVAFCSPCSPAIPTGELLPTFNTMTCQSFHGLNMKFISIDANAEFHLGYAAKDLQGRSWYDFIHPDHDSEFSSKHLELISNGSSFISSVFTRVQTKYGHFIWVQLMMRVIHGNDHCTGQPEIACVFQVLDEEEVVFMKEREQLETDLSHYVQVFDNSSAFSYGVSDEPMMQQNLMSYPVPAPMWMDEDAGRALKRKGPSNDLGGRPRKIRNLTPKEDSRSPANFPFPQCSPINHDADQAFHFGQMDAFQTGVHPEMYHTDFNLKSEEPFQHRAALSPYSNLSDSGFGSSPRMFHEDDSSFFLTVSPNPQLNNCNMAFNDPTPAPPPPPAPVLPQPPVMSPLSDLVELKTLDQDIIMHRSPMQEVPNELPELDLTDLDDYFKTVEDGKKLDPMQTAYPPPPPYAKSTRGAQYHQDLYAQNQPRAHPSTTPASYQYKTTHSGSGALMGAVSGRANGGAAFSGSAFLERLIESPEFTELIGIMSGESQRRFSVQEQGLPCYG